MTNFEKITENPTALADFLKSLPVLEGPWDTEFHARYCFGCNAVNCRAEECPHSAFRENPGWWLGLEAEGT